MTSQHIDEMLEYEAILKEQVALRFDRPSLRNEYDNGMVGGFNSGYWLGIATATASAEAKYLPVIEKLVEALKNAPVHVTKDGVWLNFRCDHEAKIGTAMVKVEGLEALAVANWGDKANEALAEAAPLLGRK